MQRTIESKIFFFSSLSHSKILLLNFPFYSSFCIRVFLHAPLFPFSAGALHPTIGTILFCLFPRTFIAFSRCKTTCNFFSKVTQNQTFPPFQGSSFLYLLTSNQTLVRLHNLIKPFFVAIAFDNFQLTLTNFVYCVSRVCT